MKNCDFFDRLYCLVLLALLALLIFTVTVSIDYLLLRAGLTFAEFIRLQ